MKLFIYKSLIIFFLLILVFKFTVGSLIKNYQEKVDTYFSEENVIITKNKIRKEMQNAIEKDNYLNKEDAILINKFLKKLQTEIFDQK